jgi:hypothetical protein
MRIAGMCHAYVSALIATAAKLSADILGEIMSARMKPVLLEKVNDGKGFSFSVGRNWKYSSGVIFNGSIWFIYVYFGRAISISIWERGV